MKSFKLKTKVELSFEAITQFRKNVIQIIYGLIFLRLFLAKKIILLIFVVQFIVHNKNHRSAIIKIMFYIK